MTEKYQADHAIPRWLHFVMAADRAGSGRATARDRPPPARAGRVSRHRPVVVTDDIDVLVVLVGRCGGRGCRGHAGSGARGRAGEQGVRVMKPVIPDESAAAGAVPTPEQVTALVLAAGAGVRLGLGPKAFLCLAPRETLLERAVLEVGGVEQRDPQAARGEPARVVVDADRDMSIDTWP